MDEPSFRRRLEEGQLPTSTVELAAYVGSQHAIDFLGTAPRSIGAEDLEAQASFRKRHFHAPDPVEHAWQSSEFQRWLLGFGRWGLMTCIRAGYAACDGLLARVLEHAGDRYPAEFVSPATVVELAKEVLRTQKVATEITGQALIVVARYVDPSLVEEEIAYLMPFLDDLPCDRGLDVRSALQASQSVPIDLLYSLRDYPLTDKDQSLAAVCRVVQLCHLSALHLACNLLWEVRCGRPQGRLEVEQVVLGGPTETSDSSRLAEVPPIPAFAERLGDCCRAAAILFGSHQVRRWISDALLAQLELA